MPQHTIRIPSGIGELKIEHHEPPCDCGSRGCPRGIECAVLNAPDSGVSNRKFLQGNVLARALHEAANWSERGTLPERRLRPEYEGRVPRTAREANGAA